MTKSPKPVRHRLPHSFKELTPANHFKPATFFRELVLKAWLTPRKGAHQTPVFPKLKEGQVAITWIGHASFLIQFTDLNVLIDPNFANWLFLLKRIKRTGLRFRDLPPIDLVLLTHAIPCALALAFVNAGNSIEARMAMIAITTSSSISVNPGSRSPAPPRPSEVGSVPITP